MSPFAKFEQQVLDLLIGEQFTHAQILEIKERSQFISLRHSGVGYFLKVTHPVLPKTKLAHSQPMVIGRTEYFQQGIAAGSANTLELGFVVFVEDHELTFECYSFGTDEVPEQIREFDVHVSST